MNCIRRAVPYSQRLPSNVAITKPGLFSMTLRLAFAAAAAAVVLFASPAVMAGDVGTIAADASEVDGEASPVRLVSFDGQWQFLKTSSRLRIMRSAIDYTLTVDAAGDVTGCTLDREFRRTYINKRLCDVLIKHHTFEPAHDASGTAVPGSYTARLVYADLRADS